MTELILYSSYILIGLVSIIFLMVLCIKTDIEDGGTIDKEDFGAYILLSLLGSVIWPATWIVIAGVQIFNKIWTSLEPKINKRRY